MSLIVSTSRLSYWTTTRPGMVARSSGAMSTSGAGGDEHAADMDRQVARQAVDAGAQLQPALPRREPDGGAARSRGDGVELDAAHARRDDPPGGGVVCGACGGACRLLAVAATTRPLGTRHGEQHARPDRSAAHRPCRAPAGRGRRPRPPELQYDCCPASKRRGPRLRAPPEPSIPCLEPRFAPRHARFRPDLQGPGRLPGPRHGLDRASLGRATLLPKPGGAGGAGCRPHATSRGRGDGGASLRLGAEEADAGGAVAGAALVVGGTRPRSVGPRRESV